MRAETNPACFGDFVARRFAGPGPFWTWMVFERIGGALAYGFGRLGVSPDAVTLLGGACGVSGALLLGLANRPSQAFGAAALLLLAYALDCADGQLARASRRASARGAWLDVATDSVVIAFVAAALTTALQAGAGAGVSAILGGAFGASRTASLFTSATVRREQGGIELSGPMRRLRTAFIATVDTPFVYAALCAARLNPGLLAAVMAALTLATTVQMLVSARHHFAGPAPAPGATDPSAIGSRRPDPQPARRGLTLRRVCRHAQRLIHAEHLGYAAIQSVLLQFLTVVANLATGVMTARLLGPAGRGHYTAAVTWPSLLGMAAAAGTADAVLVHLRRSPQDKAATVAWGCLVTLVAATALSLLAWLAMPTLLGRRQAEALSTARAALTLISLIGVSTVARQAFAGRGRYRLTNIGAFLPHLLHALTMAVFVAVSALTVQTAVLSLIVGQAGALLVLLPLLVREFKAPLAGLRESITAVSSFARRAAPGDLLSLLPQWADRLLLIVLLTPSALGLYTVAYGFSRVVTIATPASGLLLSAMSAQRRTAAKQLHDTAVRFCIASIVLTLGPAIALSGPLVRLFYGAEFMRAAPVFQLLVLQAACGRLVGVTAQFYRALDRPALASAIEFAGVVTSVALILLLVPVYGALGAAAGLLGGTILRLALLWGGLVVQLRVPLPRLWLSFEDLRSAKQLFTS